ncbi:phosphotransferase enzyme family protein [Paenarthrobacter sp. NPDC092416]|uniref:phosphotransferase enzyme family protein n=1 Tax=Paenarthrobacter sp. NPDC092416 TaxID=3364386 RepID=UPI0038204C62
MKLDAVVRTVRGALELYGIEESATIELVKYRENYVFRVNSESGDFAVRLHRAGYRNDAEIRTELDYLHALARQGLNVPEVVPTLTGALMCTVTAEDGTNFQLDVERWLQGTHPLGDIGEGLDGTSNLTPETFRALGELVGALHTMTAGIGHLPGFQRGAWNAAGLLGDDALWGDPLALEELAEGDKHLLLTAMAQLRRALVSMDTSAENYGIIHADLTPENILVQDGRLILIDFDDFGEGWHLFDLATILFFYLPHPQYWAYRQALIDGYTSVRNPGEGFLDAWDTMLLARGLTYLGWAADRKGDAEATFIAQNVVPVVLTLARNYVSVEHSSSRP